jgi:dihydrofolate synthase/folylpolyglutamate synthase
VDRGVFKDVSENFFLKGRVEVFVENGKTVVFDVAHTVFSVENLVNYLRKHFPGREFIFLVSFLRDKNLAEIGPLVSGLSSKIILTSTSNPRAFSAQDLACFFKGGVIEEDMNKAFNDSLKDLKSNQVLVVLGSHYLVGSLI